VSWSDAAESKQAVQLLPKWTEIDVDDALELLGPGFDNMAVRAYAVDRLRKADDEELQLYLLQLVQALKFERIKPSTTTDASRDSSLANFLISRACMNITLGNFFYWYLMVETEDTNQEYKRLFSKVAWEFQVALGKMEDGDKRRAVIKRQADFVFMIGEISKEIQGLRESRPKKIERLRQVLADPKNELVSFEAVPLPLDPGVNVVGCFPGLFLPHYDDVTILTNSFKRLQMFSNRPSSLFSFTLKQILEHGIQSSLKPAMISVKINS
jgi:phosphatidylinositol 3-kinase